MTSPLPFENQSSVYTHEYMVMKPCRHGTLLFNQQDMFVGRSLDLYGEWCEAEIGLLAQVLKPGDVVLDVGANIGCRAEKGERLGVSPPWTRSRRNTEG